MNASDPVIRPDILTYGGRFFDFINPQHNEFNIFDIAHALANVCRFAGHTREFYSVAQHSVLVARICMKTAARDDIIDHGRAGLLHDASEAYIGDITRPLKQLLPDYKAIEQRIEAALFSAFRIPHPLPQIVKHADLVMLATEQRDLMPPHEDEWLLIAGIEPLQEIINPWYPEKAEREFLAMWDDLMGRV
jgi:hypothetical protein